MRQPDWRIRSNQPYKNLDEQRQDDERSERRAGYSLKSRVVAGIIAAVVILAQSIPDELSGFFAAALPVIGLILALIFPIVIGVVLLLLVRRRLRRENLYAEEAPSSDAWRTFPSQPEERYPAAQYERPSRSEERYTAQTNTGSDYSQVADSWDIKDPKPPWEL